ncbi:MAG: hypothetical protein ABIH20_02585 [Candidatus Diapherotrites archaeon]
MGTQRRNKGRKNTESHIIRNGQKLENIRKATGEAIDIHIKNGPDAMVVKLSYGSIKSVQGMLGRRVRKENVHNMIRNIVVLPEDELAKITKGRAVTIRWQTEKGNSGFVVFIGKTLFDDVIERKRFLRHEFMHVLAVEKGVRSNAGEIIAFAFMHMEEGFEKEEIWKQNALDQIRRAKAAKDHDPNSLYVKNTRVGLASARLAANLTKTHGIGAAKEFLRLLFDECMVNNKETVPMTKINAMATEIKEKFSGDAK